MGGKKPNGLYPCRGRGVRVLCRTDTTRPVKEPSQLFSEDLPEFSLFANLEWLRKDHEKEIPSAHLHSEVDRNKHELSLSEDRMFSQIEEMNESIKSIQIRLDKLELAFPSPPQSLYSLTTSLAEGANSNPTTNNNSTDRMRISTLEGRQAQFQSRISSLEIIFGSTTASWQKVARKLLDLLKKQQENSDSDVQLPKSKSFDSSILAVRHSHDPEKAGKASTTSCRVENENIGGSMNIKKDVTKTSTNTANEPQVSDSIKSVIDKDKIEEKIIRKDILDRDNHSVITANENELETNCFQESEERKNDVIVTTLSLTHSATQEKPFYYHPVSCKEYQQQHIGYPMYYPSPAPNFPAQDFMSPYASYRQDNQTGYGQKSGHSINDFEGKKQRRKKKEHKT